jgi:hypothetical protein
VCYFVTLGIAEQAVAVMSALGKERYGFSFSPAKNPFVSRLFPKTDTLFYVTHGGCSCDLYTDPGHEETPDQAQNHAARYRRKGWSEAKIQRALADRNKPRPPTRRDDYRLKFRDTVSALVEEFGSIRLFAHMYDGKVEMEEIGASGHRTMPLGEFRSAGGMFAENTLIEVRRGG